MLAKKLVPMLQVDWVPANVEAAQPPYPLEPAAYGICLYDDINAPSLYRELKV